MLAFTSVALVVLLVLLAGLIAAVAQPVLRAAGASARRIDRLAISGLSLDARTKIFAADGSLVGILHGEENREPIALERVPEQVRQAVVAVEDRRFRDHNGVDVTALGRALAVNVADAGIQQGGGTITMQLARNAYLHDRRRTVGRKYEEMLLARRLEKRLTKDEILEQYLNTVYFGDGAYGIAAAAETYFGKTPSQLTLGEAALLAGVIRAPEAYDPRTRPTVALARRDLALEAMRQQGMIDEVARRDARAEPVRLVPRRNRNGIVMVADAGGPFIEYVKQQLLSDPRLGPTREERELRVFGGGLRVTTTLDLKVQRAAERAITDVLDRAGDPFAGIAVVEPATGAIRAMAGAVDPQGFNFAAQARRQPGSAFKTFTLVAALQSGISLESRYDGSDPVEIGLPGGGLWKVHNYESSPGGRMSLLTATKYSVNAVYAQVVMDAGPARVVSTAHLMGITSPLDQYPSIALGALRVGVSPLEMAAAHATLANGGIAIPPSSITLVSDWHGKQVVENTPAGWQAVSPDVAAQATFALRKVVEEGTGRRALRLGRPVAGKTGTTDEYRDAWFVGFTPQLSAAVWIGYSPVSKSLRGVHGLPQVYGGSLPAEIWTRTMAAALEGEPVLDFPAAFIEDSISPAPGDEPVAEPTPHRRRGRGRKL